MSYPNVQKRYVAAAIAVALFAFVYELFSHQVYSNWMLFAFLFPLAGGVIPFSFLAIAKKPLPRAAGRCLYGSGIAALTAGSVFQGILEIYGTTSRLSPVYWISGGCLTLAGALVCVLGRERE